MANSPGDQDTETLLHIISTNDSLEIPRGAFRRYLQEKIERNPSTMIEEYKKKVAAQRAQLKKLDLRQSPLYTSMFNGVADFGSEIDVKSIIQKVARDGLASEGPFKVVEFSAKYGKFVTGFKYTSEYGAAGNAEKPYVSADFLIKIKRGAKTTGASFSFYKSGKIRFSGGYIGNVVDMEDQPRELLTFLSDNYFKLPARIPIKFNNFTSEFRLGFPVNIRLVHDAFSETALSKFSGYTVVAKYDKKRSKFLYITFSKGPAEKFAIVMADTGVIQIQGTDDVKVAYEAVKKFAIALKNNDMLIVGGNQAQNLNAPRNTKLARRMDNMPAPNITRRGTTCPVKRRPTPYSYTGTCKGNNCYIKPNPQGQPCCYDVPKSLEYSKGKVEAAYAKAGVRVPDRVRTIFGFGQGTNNRGTNVARNVPLAIRTYLNSKDGFKIDSRQCLRYSKVALVDIATRLKIILPAKVTKPKLCELIKQASGVPTVQVKASGAIVSGANRNLRLGNRLCDTYPRPTLVRFARALGGRVEADMRKGAICKMIQDLTAARLPRLQANYNAKKAQNNKNRANAVEAARLKNLANKAAANKARKNTLAQEAAQEKANQRAASKGARNIQARLTRNLVREDLMGMLELNTINNKNVDALMTNINRAIANGTIKKSKQGFPMKASVNKIKRKFGLAMLNRLNAAGPAPRSASASASPSPKKKKPAPKKKSPSPSPNSNSNENLNYFMGGPR